jgi:hypothetical protein
MEGSLVDELGYGDLNFGQTMAVVWWHIGSIGFLINYCANPC